jgi:hypothetical protein
VFMKVNQTVSTGRHALFACNQIDLISFRLLLVSSVPYACTKAVGLLTPRHEVVIKSSLILHGSGARSAT